MTDAPRWLDKRALLMLHEESLVQFGGASGLRDEGLLDSALSRPINKFNYEGCTDLAVLAAAYGFGLARNHAFVDGNKRAAFLAVGVFLHINDLVLKADPIDAIQTMLGLAEGTLEESGFANWIRTNTIAN